MWLQYDFSEGRWAGSSSKQLSGETWLREVLWWARVFLPICNELDNFQDAVFPFLIMCLWVIYRRHLVDGLHVQAFSGTDAVNGERGVAGRPRLDSCRWLWMRSHSTLTLSIQNSSCPWNASFTGQEKGWLFKSLLVQGRSVGEEKKQALLFPETWRSPSLAFPRLSHFLW